MCTAATAKIPQEFNVCKLLGMMTPTQVARCQQKQSANPVFRVFRADRENCLGPRLLRFLHYSCIHAHARNTHTQIDKHTPLLLLKVVAEATRACAHPAASVPCPRVSQAP